LLREQLAQNKNLKEVAEDVSYCEKFGMKVGTEKHNQCLLDLGEFRMKVEKRMSEDREF
jgi:hypothetical protein